MDSKIITKARGLVEMGNYIDALKLLHPLIERKEPAALFLYSTFSVDENESDDAFERRSIDCLKAAAEAGYAPACYSLGACLEVGDMIDKNPILAASFFKQAADSGYAKAKFRHGLNLYYGSNGIVEDKISAISLIHQARNENVQEAYDFIVLNNI